MDRKQVMARQKALVDAYNVTRDGTPRDTLDLLAEKIGSDEMRLAVAETVRSVGDWDGRVYDYIREWADGVEGAASREEMEAAYIYQPSSIHPAHINQLGTECRRMTK